MSTTMQPVQDTLPFARPDSMIPGSRELGIMICEFATKDGAKQASKMALMAYAGPDIGLRVSEPDENSMLSTFERMNNRPYTDQVRQAGKTYCPTLMTREGQKVLPRFVIGEMSEARELVFVGPNVLNPNAGDKDFWVSGMDGNVIIPKIVV